MNEEKPNIFNQLPDSIKGSGLTSMYNENKMTVIIIAVIIVILIIICCYYIFFKNYTISSPAVTIATKQAIPTDFVSSGNPPISVRESNITRIPDSGTEEYRLGVVQANTPIGMFNRERLNRKLKQEKFGVYTGSDPVLNSKYMMQEFV